MGSLQEAAVWNKAFQHHRNVEAIEARVIAGDLGEIEGGRQCLKECTAGIDLLKAGMTNREVLDVLSKLRSKRADYLCLAIVYDLGHGRITPETISNCRQQFEDATACIDLSPAHSTPEMVCHARGNRMIAFDYLKNTFKVPDVERETKLVLEDCRIQMADPNATAEQKQFAGNLMKCLKDVVSPPTEINTIRPAFLTHSDLCQVEGLNIGKPKSRRTFIARNYMDKKVPVTMSDGSPKPLPPGMTSVDRFANMTPSQLMQFYGPNSGGFFGEHAFWKRHNGIFLGKHKWEAEGDMERDTNTCSEVWDMRWVCKTAEDAKNFCKDMIEISRMDDNNGMLDGVPTLGVKASELARLDDSIEELVFCSNKPKKRPARNNQQGQFMMSMNPPLYLQQYVAVFVIGRCVVKTYVIEGYNPTQGKLERSCMFGPKGLLNTVAKATTEWLDGKRSEFDAGTSGSKSSSLNNLSSIEKALPSLSVCAGCGVERDDLMRCSRCKKVAYCCRDCQVSNWKEHKGPCKRAAAQV